MKEKDRFKNQNQCQCGVGWYTCKFQEFLSLIKSVKHESGHATSSKTLFPRVELSLQYSCTVFNVVQMQVDHKHYDSTTSMPCSAK